MTNRARDGSITLDCDAQTLEVARQVGIGLFMVGIDHLTCNGYVRNLFLNDLVIDFDDKPGIDSTARDSDQTYSLDCFTHANGQCSRLRDSEKCAPRRYYCRELLTGELRAVFPGQHNRRHEFWGTHEELRTKEDYDKFVHSFKDNYPGKCKDRSVWTIDCRKFDDPDNDRSMKKHIDRNPKIMKSILESGNYHAVRDRLNEGMYRLFSDKNMVIMMGRSGRHRSVANAELRSKTLTRCGRRQHSVSLLHLSELDFWEKHVCAGNCSECSKQSLRVFASTLRSSPSSECLRRVPVPDPVTGRWKRPRPEHAEGPAQPVKDHLMRKTLFHKLRKGNRQVPRLHLSRRARVAEPWMNWHSDSEASKKAPVPLASCLQKRNVPRDRNGQVHVSQIAGGGKGRLGSRDATVTRGSLYRDQSLSSPRGIERQICTSGVNRNCRLWFLLPRQSFIHCVSSAALLGLRALSSVLFNYAIALHH